VLLPGDPKRGGREKAPGKEPDQVQRPVKCRGELVVVAGDAFAEEAEDVLVDEVEPEETVAVRCAGVAQPGEDMPRSGDRQEEQRAGDGRETPPLRECSGDEAEGQRRAAEEHQRDQALGEDGEG
jgi:hypothetical protein